MGRKEVDKRADRHIRITDTTLTEQIDKIMQYPEFKSFSKVINEALYIALPQIIERLEGREQITLPEVEHRKDEEFYGQVVRLMKEMIMNANINKALLSSLFEAELVNLRHRGATSIATAMETGCFQDLPQFADDYEVRTLRKIRNE